MPELPEVETTRRGLEPLLVGRTIRSVTLHNRSLRWPVACDLSATLAGQTVLGLRRRSKYLLIGCSSGTLIVHLGMTGHLRVVESGMPLRKHDHVEVHLENNQVLRFNDSRRFGAILWTDCDPCLHPLLRDLGPEPFSDGFSGDYLAARAAGRVVAVKPFLMDAKVVVGVGNIYASEALFRAGIDPRRSAGKVSLKRFRMLALTVREVLSEAIEAGGTTIRDFANSSGEPGYFRIRLKVYGRGGEPCLCCGKPLTQVRLGQRSTYFCSKCQR